MVNLKEVATKVAMIIGVLLTAFLFWFFFPSEIPDYVYWGGVVFILIFLLLETKQRK